MSPFSSAHLKTPALSVVDPRGLAVRQVAFYRADAANLPTERVNRSAYDTAGRPVRRWDPRLWGAANNDADAPANLDAIYSLTGQTLCTQHSDPGWRAELLGEAGQRQVRWDAEHRRQRVEYDVLLRALAVFATHEGQETCLERLIYGGPDERHANRCGQLTRHDDSAGSVVNAAFSLTGQANEQTRRFLSELIPHESPEVEGKRDCALEHGSASMTRWRFDATGEVIEQTDAMGNTQCVNHTVAGQLKRTRLQLRNQDLRTLVSDIRYDAHNRIESETAGNGIVTTLDYDSVDGRLRNLRTDNGRLQDLDYRYDPVGNVVSIEDRAQPTRYFANQQVEPLRTFVYDSLSQLIEATGYESSTANKGPTGQSFATADALSNYTQRYEYDAGGNLQKLIHSGTRHHTHHFAIAQFSNRSLLQTGPHLPTEEQIAAGFDANGNLRELSPGQALSWTPRNQLSEVTPVERETGANDQEIYQYDAAGKRVRKVRFTLTKALIHLSEVRYLPGLEIRSRETGEVLHLLTVIAGHNPIRVLHWEAGQPAEVDHPLIRFNVVDPIGSCTLVLDQGGKLISQEVYHPYGETAWFAGRSKVDAVYRTVRYSGKERDATGLYDYGVRYYAPVLMRWLNPDPAGDIDGLNRYAFVTANPVSGYDSNGAMFTCASRSRDTLISALKSDGYRVRYQGVDKMKKASETDLVFAIDAALNLARELIQLEVDSFKTETDRLEAFLALAPHSLPEGMAVAVSENYQSIAKGLSSYQQGGHLRNRLIYVETTNATPLTFAFIQPGDLKKRVFITDHFRRQSVIANASVLVHEMSHSVLKTQDYFYYENWGLGAEQVPCYLKSRLALLSELAVGKNGELRRTATSNTMLNYPKHVLSNADFWGAYLLSRPLSLARHEALYLDARGQREWMDRERKASSRSRHPNQFS
ncbi:RHS repeat-associated core domain-containing protein [Pseudomonas sp. RC10]|uniref:RHS repeat-associated core domain-containing protein n=1 Tax=Pseudomonas bambusae TaxID=3139142 RepID=UPI003139D224